MSHSTTFIRERTQDKRHEGKNHAEYFPLMTCMRWENGTCMDTESIVRTRLIANSVCHIVATRIYTSIFCLTSGKSKTCHDTTHHWLVDFIPQPDSCPTVVQATWSVLNVASLWAIEWLTSVPSGERSMTTMERKTWIASVDRRIHSSITTRSRHTCQ